ncbi:septum formation inhibitor Maf [Paucihalobacter ruber]|uniref:Septum formation inhibitor Maf n=1 Tax=Paucihalobacter ruber TaxID=2567861 RepID=A0A506PEH3_9FLAO|nr:septum formation inhibitor Maf [Paucihalobacter ruber]TPV32341.1 septum formation inhibitor Maf [Paucihalobacter ruber]
MHSFAFKQTILITLLYVGFCFFSCENIQPEATTATTENTNKLKSASPYRDAQQLSDEFKMYWFNGKAEISSYKLEQARYGEMHEGSAVLIFVTEDFLPDVQVKADSKDSENIGVLKLNATKDFNTGIYPYHIMQSTFYPLSNNYHALKVTASIQEWCGQVYSQINNRGQFEVLSHSYFEGEADEEFNLDETILENELFNQLRINPKSLPTGDIKIIPSLEYLRLKHRQIKLYKATAKLTDSTYAVYYPDLGRSLEINFKSDFPYTIDSFKESYTDGADGAILTTTAKRINTILEPYWQKNKPDNSYLRAQLGL